MIRLRFILVLIASMSMTFGNAQEDDDIIKLHYENLKNLYKKRGAPPDWAPSGIVDDNYLHWSIAHYKSSTAILIYTFENDTLKVDLFNQKKERKSVTSAISRNDLSEAVDRVNRLFSTSFMDNGPSMRGSKATSNSVSVQDQRLAYNMLNDLLLPDAFQLGDYNHLIIVPVLNISTLPFAAMKIGDRYLIDSMSYSIAPSLFELMVSNKVNTDDYRYKKKKYDWQNALFVSNPKFPNDTIWHFPALPGTDKEVDLITKSLADSTFTRLSGAEATKETVLKKFCEYDLLYFATHGISNSENPMDHSFLVLSETENASGYLTFNEIMHTRKECMLNADLVVLSACQTGLGMSHEGGIIGLARSFQIAGANHVLMSLWNINDQETANLMSGFFGELFNSKEFMPHEALRKAILNYKNEVNADPKYWAAFSIFGVPY